MGNNVLNIPRLPAVGAMIGGNMAISKGLLSLPINVKPLNSFKAGTSRQVKLWNSKEFEEKKAKGICYWCEEKCVKVISAQEYRFV